MEKIRNNCYECPHRREVPGSAHSSCFIGKPMEASCLLAYLNGQTPILTDDQTGELLLKVNPQGAEKGWAIWPLNFDPVWIECYLPIKNTKIEK